MRHNRRLNREPNEHDSVLGLLLIIVIVACMATWWFAHRPVIEVPTETSSPYR